MCYFCVCNILFVGSVMSELFRDGKWRLIVRTAHISRYWDKFLWGYGSLTTYVGPWNRALHCSVNTKISIMLVQSNSYWHSQKTKQAKMSAPTRYAAVLGVATGCVTLGNSRPRPPCSRRESNGRLIAVKVFDVPWLWHSTYSWPGERLCWFWFFYVVFVFK